MTNAELLQQLRAKNLEIKKSRTAEQRGRDEVLKLLKKCHFDDQMTARAQGIVLTTSAGYRVVLEKIRMNRTTLITDDYAVRPVPDVDVAEICLARRRSKLPCTRWQRLETRLRHELYDKTHHLVKLSRRLPRYPNALSQIPPSIKKDVIISQLSRIYTKSCSETSFLRDSLHMVLRHDFNNIPTRCVNAAIRQWKPRSTCHLTWKATYENTTQRLHCCLHRHKRLYRGRADASEIRQGVSNPALENYILELVTLC